MRDPSYATVISEAWKQPPFTAEKCLLSQKIAATTAALKQWNKFHYGFIAGKIKQLRAELIRIQSLPCSWYNQQYELHRKTLLDEQLQREQVMWRQKSKTQWLTSQELNTMFFYTSTIIRRSNSVITSLKDSSGNWITDCHDIGQLFVQHFSSIFSSQQVSPLSLGLSRFIL